MSVRNCLGSKMEVIMDILLVLRIALVGIVVSIINQMLNQQKREDLALATSIAGLVLVLYWLLPHIIDLFTTIQQMFQLVS